MKLSQAANKVIALAEAIQSYWDRELRKRHPDYPFVHPGEDDGPPPPEEKKLQKLLARLPEDMIYKLALITDLVWGNFGIDDLPKRYEALKKKNEKPEEVISFVLTQPSIAENLTDGLAELKKRGIDVDKLTFASVNSAS